MKSPISPEPPSSAPSASEPAAGGIFGAFRTSQVSRTRRWVLLFVFLAALIEGLVLFSGRNEMRIVTAHGIRSLRRGMRPEDVMAVLGKPLAPADAPPHAPPGTECFRYGELRWRTAFTVFSACYQNGKLLEVSAKRFGIWRITQDGTVLPFEEDTRPRW